MARVPVLAPQSAVDPRPIAPGYQTDVGATPAAFGAGNAADLAALGKGAQQLGNTGVQIATEMQADDNDRALKQADVTLADKTRTILYGDGTANNPGYFAKRGDDAVNAAPSTMAALQQAHADIMGGIDNQHVKEIFGAAGQQRIISAQSSVGSFLDQQRLVANVGASQARVGSTINDAAAAWNDPKQLALSLGTINNEMIAQGKLQGWSADETKAKFDDAKASLFANVIKAAGRTGDFATAQRIFQDNIDQIPGSAQGAIERELRTDQRNARVDQQLAFEQAKRAENDRQQKASDALFSSAIHSDGTIAVPPGFAASVKAAGLKFETAHSLISAVESLSAKDGKIQDAPGMLPSLLRGASIPEGQPGHVAAVDVYNAVADGKLSKESAGFALGAVKPENLGDTQTINRALEGAMTTMVPGYLPGAPTQASDAIQGRLYPWLYKAIQDGKAEGKSVNSMLTPGGKDYLMTPEALQRVSKPNGDDVTGPSVLQRINSAIDYIRGTGSAAANPLAAPGSKDLAPKAPAKAANGKPPLTDFFGTFGGGKS